VWKYLINHSAVKQKSPDNTGENRNQFLFTLYRSYTKYEGKSLNNRNFIITFFTRVLTEIVCVIFRPSPPASQHTRSTWPQACGCPLEKSFLAWPLHNFAPPPLPRCHLQTCGPANKVQTSESKITVSILNLHSSVDFRRFHT